MSLTKGQISPQMGKKPKNCSYLGGSFTSYLLSQLFVTHLGVALLFSQVYPLKAEAVLKDGSNSLGTISFTQNIGVVQNPTQIKIDINSVLLTKKKEPKIHSNYKEKDACTNLGNMFDPYLVSKVNLYKVQTLWYYRHPCIN